MYMEMYRMISLYFNDGEMRALPYHPEGWIRIELARPCVVYIHMCSTKVFARPEISERNIIYVDNSGNLHYSIGQGVKAVDLNTLVPGDIQGIGSWINSNCKSFLGVEAYGWENGICAPSDVVSMLINYVGIMYEALPSMWWREYRCHKDEAVEFPSETICIQEYPARKIHIGDKFALQRGGVYQFARSKDGSILPRR